MASRTSRKTSLQRLISEGKKVVLMSFCAAEGDEVAITRILEKFPSKDMESYFYNGDISEALSILKSSNGVIATRFHSLILGWVFNKPVFTFEYSDKTLNLLNDIEFEGYHLSIEDISNIDIEKTVEQLIQKDPQNITKERKEAENHFLKNDILECLEEVNKKVLTFHQLIENCSQNLLKKLSSTESSILLKTSSLFKLKYIWVR